jgi:protein-disulfide isomerase
VSTASKVCTVPVTPAQMSLNLQKIDLTRFPTLNAGSSDTLFMIACYHCDFSRETYPLIRSLVDRFHVSLTFIHYPVKEPTDRFSKLGYCVNKISPDKFWAYNDQMFVGNKTNLDDPTYINTLLDTAGIDSAKINACIDDPQTEATVKAQMEQVASTGFTGTPTIFLRDQVFIGPKPYRVYAIALRGLFYWLQP